MFCKRLILDSYHLEAVSWKRKRKRPTRPKPEAVMQSGYFQHQCAVSALTKSLMQLQQATKAAFNRAAQ